jgi:putative phosphoribosyl transferase
MRHEGISTNIGEQRLHPLFKNRDQVGELLANELKNYAYRDDVIVLALPRGGVPVAFKISQALQVPLDLILVRKLGTPGQAELAMGAIATGGVRILNKDVIRGLDIDQATLDAVAAREQKELERRERAYRGERALPELQGKHVILVDDGLATGATMLAAVSAVKQFNPERIIVAVPVAPSDTVERLKQSAHEVICLKTPQPFIAIGRWYVNFNQVSDEEVKNLLQQAWERSSA